MPEYNPNSGPEPKRPVAGWLMIAVLIFLFLCVLVIALLLPWVHTSGAAYAIFAITLTGSLLTGLLSSWMVRK